MPKTKESISAYNKEYFSRPEVIARAKVRNAQRRDKRKAYKKTPKGRLAENRYRNKRYQTDSEKSKRLFLRYGITLEEYKQILEAQDNGCCLCGRRDTKPLHVDHDHKTGKVRGLLCSSCNMGLGLFGDDSNLLQKAINYLKDS